MSLVFYWWLSAYAISQNMINAPVKELILVHFPHFVHLLPYGYISFLVSYNG